MTIKFTRYKNPEYEVGSEIVTHIGLETVQSQQEFLGRKGKITAIENGMDLHGKLHIYTINVDGGEHYWFKDELRLI